MAGVDVSLIHGVLVSQQWVSIWHDFFNLHTVSEDWVVQRKKSGPDLRQGVPNPARKVRKDGWQQRPGQSLRWHLGGAGRGVYIS